MEDITRNIRLMGNLAFHDGGSTFNGLIDRRKAKDAANNSGQRYPYTNLPQASA
jgi:hypothetical protein